MEFVSLAPIKVELKNPVFYSKPQNPNFSNLAIIHDVL